MPSAAANVVPLEALRARKETTPPRPNLPVILTPEELAVMLKLPSVETVYQWRRKRTGPPGFRAGRHVRFELTAVLDWMAEQRQTA